MFRILHAHSSIKVSFLRTVTSAGRVGKIQADDFDKVFLTSPADSSAQLG